MQLNSINDVRENISTIETEIRKRIVGMDEVIKLLLVCLFASPGRNCHVLLEGVPGLAKTLLLKSLAETVEGEFRRISFAADLLPKDVVGIEDFDSDNGKVRLLVKGPLFTNFLLADELNRARTTSKGMILEPMEEGMVTTELGGTYPLADLFMVAATQNPIEEEGTFVLGRAEQDRFVMKILVTYPNAEQERDIIRKNIDNMAMPSINPVMDTHAILAIRRAIFDLVKVSDEIIEKVQRLVALTRPGYTDISEIDEYIDAQDGGGASPRAGIHILRTARAHAAISGRDFVSPEDISSVMLPVLRHRLILRPELAMNNMKERERLLNDMLDRIFQRVWSQ
ncbi:MAG: AAA family ATPase [Gammaproteobacteria bacterium]|jgi:MoxR-like ATPase